MSHDRLQKCCQHGHLRPRPAVVSKRGDDGALERVDEAGLELVEILERERRYVGRAEAKGPERHESEGDYFRCAYDSAHE